MVFGILQPKCHRYPGLLDLTLLSRLTHFLVVFRSVKIQNLLMFLDNDPVVQK